MGFLLHQGATVLCSHGGQAMPSAPNPRVMVSGQPTLLLSAPWVIAGCPFTTAAPMPCVTGQYVAGTVRVTSTGQPLIAMESQAVCVPNGTPLMPVTAQTRVVGM
jgi:hypothetical protein